MTAARRVRISIGGTVQGVGFRPYVCNLARSLSLSGFVLNTPDGVTVEAEGAEVEAFLERLPREVPPLARIADWRSEAIPPQGDSGFEIRHSAGVGDMALVPADIGTCDDCVRDFTQPGGRRFGYPFTNCTHCGPRYSIIADVPYDRPATTMAGFAMCPACAAEYSDPGDRRFHAQPNACPECGPSLSAPVEQVRAWLATGEIVAVKGLGGYHLACDARNADAIRRLRERKRRSEKPFAVMVRDLAAADRAAVLDEGAREALQHPRRPILLLPSRDVCPEVAPGNPRVGLMLPYTPLHYLLFEDAPYDALVMTSGNLSEEPIVSREEELPRLDGIADRVVTHNRPIRTRVDDSVARLFRGRMMVLRRSRGYAPAPIDLRRPLRQILAVGGELKNTFCLTKSHYAILSQHIGDLENYETLAFFRETLEHMRRFFRVTPEAVAHDLHPGYLSTRAALEMDLPRIGVQHHHAHVAACMAENRLDGPVIGVAFDGTGYGLDGAIWGGEILVADYAHFERRLHLRYVPMAGGDAAVREPWRMALALLRDSGSDGNDVAALAAIPARRRAVVEAMLDRGVNTVMTSSCGRLFDAVAAITGVRLECNYEAQAAIELEARVTGDAEPYPFDLSGGEAGGEIDLRAAIREMARDPREAASRFHSTVAAAIAEACARVRRETGIRRVCLTGGSFQNVVLLERTIRRLDGFEVYWHSEVPPNDGGLALGQALVANAQRM